jgi:hypothetical protein
MVRNGCFPFLDPSRARGRLARLRDGIAGHSTVPDGTRGNHQVWVMTLPRIAIIVRADPLPVLEADMAAPNLNYENNLERITALRNRRKHRPRRCMLVSMGLILSGMGIPLLIAMHVFSANYFFVLAGLNLVALGGVMALIFYGEI